MRKKQRKQFAVHKCVNPQCPYYLHNQISHQQVANYCKTAALCVKPFVDNYDYKTGSTFTADETYIKVRGIKGYVRLIMDAAKRSIIGCRHQTAAVSGHASWPCGWHSGT